MPNRVHATFVFLLIVLAHAWCIAQAPPEDNGTTTEPAVPAEVPKQVVEVEPETYYLPDEDGNLVPMLNIPFSEFMARYEQGTRQATSGSSLPTHIVEGLSIEGKALAERAELTVSVTIRALQDGWVLVPLRFSESAQRQTPRCDTEGDIFFRYEEDNGWVCWLRTTKDAQHTITMELLTPVRQLGGESRLSIQTPRATSSAFQLFVPQADATGVVSSGFLETQQQDGGTNFVITGVGGHCDLTWRRGAARTVLLDPLLSVTSQSLIRVDDLMRATADVQFNVDSSRGEFDAFQVRLPSGARLLPNQMTQSGLAITAARESDESAGSLVQVKLDRPTRGPVRVTLQTEWVRAASALDAPMEVGGFEVVDAIRQTGTIDFVIPDQLSVAWKPGPTVYQDAIPEARKANVDAHFQAVRQPFSLRMQLASLITRVHVEPVYVLYIEEHRVRLEAQLDYRVRGTDLSSLRIEIPGWRVRSVTPENLVKESVPLPTEDGNLDITLASRPTNDRTEFQLQVLAERDITEQADLLTLSLPRVVAESRAPATVAIVPDDNIELTVDPQELKGLYRDSSPPALKLPPRQQSTLYFREQGDSTEAVFAANVRVRKRAVSIHSDTTLQFQPQLCRVEQDFRYNIAYEPLRFAHFLVPKTLLDSGELRIVSNRQALRSFPLDEAIDAESDETLVGLKVDLLEMQNGPCEIAITYDYPNGNPTEDNVSNVSIPLVVPMQLDAVITGCTLHVLTEDDLKVEVSDETWQREQSNGEFGVGDTTFLADAMPSRITMQLRRSSNRPSQTTTIAQAWFQTWVNGKNRRDRAVYRVTTNRTSLKIRVPDAAIVNDIALNGIALPVPTASPESDLTIPIEPVPAEEQVIELWYSLPRQQQSLSQIALLAPRIENATWAKRYYWQVITPATEHLLLGPSNATSEMTWQWKEGAWRRISSLDQVSLEHWVGASQQTPANRQLNQYLFGSFGEIQDLTCTTIQRSAVLILASGLVLIVGLGVIYLSWLRHPAAFLVVGVVVASCILVYPSLSLALLQASVVGVLLVCSALALKWLVDLRQRKDRVLRGTTYAGPDSNTVRSGAAGSDSNSYPTTATAPAPPPLSAAESKP